MKEIITSLADWRAWVVTVIVLLLISAYVRATQKSVESEGKKQG